MTTIAYVDPGVGQLVWQMAAAAVVGCLYYVARHIKRIRAAARWLLDRAARIRRPQPPAARDPGAGTEGRP